ncbi:MAG: DUF4124 domain-containing protein [Spongiibacteraceae bacterium]|nr:DUF4124 domain-containing protein [Spongiibacteraceae bacterium]
MNKTTQIAIAIVAMACVISLQAGPLGHYRWTDSEGNTHYSDRPPEGVQSELIKITTGKPSLAPQTSSTDNAAKQEAADSNKTMEVLPEKDPKLCKQAQGNLKALKAARIRITESDGSKRILTEDEKEKQRSNARKFIELHCG